MPLDPRENSTIRRICDKHLKSRKIMTVFRRIFIAFAIYLIIESSVMLNCAVLGNVYTQA